MSLLLVHPLKALAVAEQLRFGTSMLQTSTGTLLPLQVELLTLDRRFTQRRHQQPRAA